VVMLGLRVTMICCTRLATSAWEICCVLVTVCPWEMVPWLPWLEIELLPWLEIELLPWLVELEESREATVDSICPLRAARTCCTSSCCFIC